jgi:2-polyprenyl-3-methyl-5-hydroxy-6-metoxy-1,4-benzoquinol methylase
MNGDEVERRKATIAEKYGPWTAHSIALGDGVHTLRPWFDTRLRRIVQIAGDLLGYPFDGRRVLDLACLEGQLAIEFAIQGASVVAIEGRAANLEKAKFAAEVLGLKNVELLLGDVRDLSVERHGKFDLILCAGILYHLDTPDVMEFVQRIADVCQDVAIFDTHISLTERDSFEWRGRVYRGKSVEEHPPGASTADVNASLWYSLDNKSVFKFTRDSLCNLLRHVGFTSVFECLVPYEAYHADWPGQIGPRNGGPHELKDRITLIGVKGERRSVLTSPFTDARPDLDRLERSDVNGLLERSGRHVGRLLDLLLNRAHRKISGGLTGLTRPASPKLQD